MALPEITSCYWPPAQVPTCDAVIYEQLRGRIIRAHCADGRDDHRCAGRITMDRTTMTLQCPRCGDLKLNTTIKGGA